MSSPTYPSLRFNAQFSQPDQNHLECELNGTKFALITVPRESENDLELNYKGMNVVLLAPLTANGKITVKADLFIALDYEIEAKGGLSFNETKRVILLGTQVLGELTCDKDPITPPIYSSRAYFISSLFQQAVLGKDLEKLLVAFAETYDAIIDSTSESEEQTIGTQDVCNYFNIPVQETLSA